MEEVKRKIPKPCPESTICKVSQAKSFDINKMSHNKDKVPDNHLNASTNSNLKKKLGERKASHSVQDGKGHHSGDKKGQDKHGRKSNQSRETQNNQGNPAPYSSKKESIGDGYLENTQDAKPNELGNVDNSSNDRDRESDGSYHDAFDGDFDSNLPSTVALLTSPGGSKVYVVGTVHYSLKSQEDVARIIRQVQPNFVILELCKTRSVMLQWDEETVFKQAQNMSFGEALKKSFQLGFLEGLFFITLFSLSVRMTKELGIAPGGEFRIAYREAGEVPDCQVICGDLPMALTLKRLFSTLSLWQVLKIVASFLFKNKKMSQEEVEKYRKMDEVEKMLLQFSKESPDIARVLVNERDAVLTYYLQLAAEHGEPNKVVGVVGLGHLMGIKENWGKVSKEQMREIMRVPPPRRHFKVIKYSLKFTAIGLVLYGVHKIASKSNFYRSLFSTLFPTLS